MPHTIPESELILNPDGSIYHLHLHPEDIANKIILVGDPARVQLIASHFDTITCDIQNREFHTITGTYGRKNITVVSTGIGCGNIDIVMNELDAIANIDLESRQIKERHRQLEFVRIGTCGGLQPFTPEGTFVASATSIGLDGLLNFYQDRNNVCDTILEKKFVSHMGWQDDVCNVHPYAINANQDLIERIANDMIKGITITCNGFFGPQGRILRIPLADTHQNEKISSFTYNGLHITNFEMESSAVAGLAALLGHKAMTCCLVIANRIKGKANVTYKKSIDELIIKVLERI